jgi:DNA polymerase I-like protein with 3'-5' exonuclease and polymerase domains/5'-3' exonuclease
MKPWLLFDMSSVLWQNLLAGRDGEFGRKLPDPNNPEKVVHVNSAAYGFENFVNNLVATLERLDAVPRQVVMVFDGKGAKLLRQSIYAEYKAGRDHHPASYEEFEKLRTMVTDTLLGLGAISVTQEGMEADDIICYLSQRLGRSTVVSSDGDLLALQSERCDVWNTGKQELNVNKYGPFSPRFITLYKALVGDPSDRIKGAFKFGEKAFVDLLCAFGEEGLECMEGLIQKRELERLVEDVEQLKVLQRIIDSKESVYVSWALARMYPDKVNTMRRPLETRAGMVRQWDAAVHDARLKKWYGTKTLVHMDNYEEVQRRMLPHLLESPEVSLDLEGSAPPESTEWLEAKKRAAGVEDGGDVGVDVLGMELTGYSLTFGRNGQHTVYVTCDHVERPGAENVYEDQARQLIELIPTSKPTVVHNASCELSVLFQQWGEVWKNNGWHGFLPNVYDTMVMKSYVDENSSIALKACSETILGYKQTSYEEVTQGRKMRELTAAEAFNYGCDDTICTSALYNYFRFWMEIENTLHIYEAVERKPAYLNALRYVRGTAISLEKMFELEKADEKTAAAAWATVRDFLIKRGWEGTVCPRVETPADLTAAKIKEIYEIVAQEELRKEDGKAVLIKKADKLIAFVREKDELLGSVLEAALGGEVGPLNDLIKVNFGGEPAFNPDSPPQMKKLLYETLGLPVRLHNKPTDAMRAEGRKQGNPKADDFALQFAIKYDADKGEDVVKVLKAVQDMRVMGTRRKLYYVPYRSVRHWKDNLVHANVNQCFTVTRRYSASGPNTTQLPKNAKHGHPARFREVFVAHHKRAVVVSLDFKAQELVNIAEQSQDPNLLLCFAPPPGQKPKDLHVMTGAGIWKKKTVKDLCRMAGYPDTEYAACVARWARMDYDQFLKIYKDPTHVDHKLAGELRQIGKKVNFTTEYGAQAPKIAETLVIEEAEAKVYIEAKYEQFPRAEQWKKDVIANEVQKLGYTTTMLGARRHLRDKVMSGNRIESSGAERQGVNFKIQGSCAEQTKLAEGRFWEHDLCFKYDALYIGPIHDEVVWSVGVEDLIPWLREAHSLMIENYGGMKVPIISSISFGPDFGQQIEVGDVVDENIILETLRKLGFEDIMTPA